MSQKIVINPLEAELLKDLQERIRFSYSHNWEIPPIFNEWLGRVAPYFQYEHITKMEAKKQGYKAMTYSYSRSEYMQLEKAIGDICRGGQRAWVLVKDSGKTNHGLELWTKLASN
jgi:hypothetical protein